MPLYEYECDACGNRFEHIQKFSDPLVDKCPKCGGPVHKLMSSPAIQFKGSGWYITDYAKKDHVAAAKADSQAESSSKDKSEKGGEGGKGGNSADGGKSDKSDSSAKSDSASASSSSTSSSSSDSTPSSASASSSAASAKKD
jgi:putative FmdB family regulatory protein